MQRHSSITTGRCIVILLLLLLCANPEGAPAAASPKPASAGKALHLFFLRKLQAKPAAAYGRRTRKREARPVVAEQLPMTADSPDFPELDAALQALMRRYHIPGLSVAIARNEKLVFTRGHGYANTESRLPVSNTSLFRIASLSKPITAVAILKLVQDGKLTLEDKVFGPTGILQADYPMPSAGSGKDQITVQHLLDHTSGWTNDPDDPMFRSATYSQQQLITEMLLHRPLTYSPGTTYSYSNFGYCLLGRIIEKVSGLAYDQYVQTELLQPAGITRMQLAPASLRRPLPYEVNYYQPEGNAYVYNIHRMDAHGGWVASATDLLRLMVRIDRNPAKSDLLRSDVLGKSYFACTTWSHTGSLPGSSTVLTRLNDEFSFVVLANTRVNALPALLADEINALLSRMILSRHAWADTDLFEDRPESSTYALESQ